MRKKDCSIVFAKNDTGTSVAAVSVDWSQGDRCQQKESDMNYPVPNAPFNNPPLPEGTYDAIVHSVIEGEYGEQQKYLKVILEVPAAKQAFVTNFYFPNGLSTVKAVQRFWHFCKCVGMVFQDYFDRPRDFCGQRLRVVVHQVTNPKVNGGPPYCDVKLFLPPDGDAAPVED
jgi:hypothetical protein